MEDETKHFKCTEIARITLPWGGKLLNYCPVHANKMVLLAQAMGSRIQVQLLSKTSFNECESINDILTEEEKELNKTFKK